MTPSKLSKRESNPDISRSQFNIYEFLSTYYPDYSHSDEIAWMDDLAKFLDGEVEEGDAAEWCVADFGNNYYDAEILHWELLCKSVLVAIGEYRSQREQESIRE